MQIKFLTINIWFGGIVWENLVEFIKSEKPDVLALQEVYDGKDEKLEKRFRTLSEFQNLFKEFLPHHAFGPTLTDSSVGLPWGNALFSKFPIRNSQTLFFDLPYGEYNFSIDPDPRLAAEGMLEAEIEVNDKSVFAYSWHGVWNNHGGDTKEREIMQRKISESLKDKKTIILAGDTNMDPTTNAVKRIIDENNLDSVFGNTLTTTFNVSRKKIKGNYATSPVDMIFVSKDIQILEKEMPQVDISDHYPLKAILEI